MISWQRFTLADDSRCSVAFGVDDNSGRCKSRYDATTACKQKNTTRESPYTYAFLSLRIFLGLAKILTLYRLLLCFVLSIPPRRVR